MDNLDIEKRRNEERVGLSRSRMDLYNKENESLKASEQLANDITETINHNIFMIGEQDDRLTKIRMKWNDMKGVLGLSNKVMELIKSKNKTDRVLVFGG